MRMKGKQIPEYVKYSTFEITYEKTKYVLKISGRSGNLTTYSNAMDFNNNQKFSTVDSDNDEWSDNCAVHHSQGGGSGWWYYNCSLVILNAPYKFTKSGGEIAWYLRYAQPEFVEMKMRRYL